MKTKQIFQCDQWLQDLYESQIKDDVDAIITVGHTPSKSWRNGVDKVLEIDPLCSNMITCEWTPNCLPDAIPIEDAKFTHEQYGLKCYVILSLVTVTKCESLYATYEVRLDLI